MSSFIGLYHFEIHKKACLYFFFEYKLNRSIEYTSKLERISRRGNNVWGYKSFACSLDCISIRNLLSNDLKLDFEAVHSYKI